MEEEQKREIIRRLKDAGFRITKRRLMLLDIILKGDCSSAKEIIYKASKIDSSIGSATVYRMLNILEDIGVIKRNNIYQIDSTCIEYGVKKKGYEVILYFDDMSTLELDPTDYQRIVEGGLRASGYMKGKKLSRITSVSNE